MKKVLLINPPFNIEKENYDSSISVGLLCIATYLDNKGVKVKVIDGVRQKNYLEIIKKDVKNFDIVGLSVMTMQVSNALEICELIRKENKNAKIIWGGSHATFFPKETVEHKLVDIVCCGEGEETLLELANSKKLNKIKGITYKKLDEIKFTPKRGLMDPKKTPTLNWKLVPKEILHNLYLIPSLTSRGCPHFCTFCINAILKNKWRPKSAGQVLHSLEVINQKEYFRDKKLRFWDENFFVDIKRAKFIIDGMLERKINIPWETTVRANYFREGMIDDAFLKKLKKSGCYLLSFGAESGSPKILKKIKKHITPEDVIRSAKMCLRHGIIPQYSFMIGLPQETKKDMMMTLSLIDKLAKLSDKIQILGPQAFRPYPGSELYEECVASGWKAPETLEEWADLARNELSYLAIKNFPWVRHKDFVESMEAYVRFGAHSFKSAMGSSVKAKRFLKMLFVIICKIRWKLKFFAFPIEFKMAKKFVTK